VNLSRSPLTRRALALAILLGVIALVWSVAVQPLLGLAVNRRAANALFAEQVGDLEAAAAREPELQRRLRDGRRQLAATGGFWTGAGAAAVAASVEDRLRAAVAAGGGRVTSTSAAREAVELGFRKIAVHCTIEGSLDTMIKTLTAIETARPALFADNLAVAVRETAGDRKGPPILDIDLDVSGYSAQPGS
jgi:general secretion pathway protein M